MIDDIEQEARALYHTFDGIEVEIVKVVNSALYQFTNAKGGVLAKELEGMWTTPQKAKETLDEYNKAGVNKAIAKELQKAEEAKATKDLIDAPTTPDNHVEQRMAKLKEEKKTANA